MRQLGESAVPLSRSTFSHCNHVVLLSTSDGVTGISGFTVKATCSLGYVTMLRILMATGLSIAISIILH